MQKVAIIGIGHVGATVAYTLFTHGTASEILLFDHKGEKVEAEYRDLHDAVARDHFTVSVEKTVWENDQDWAKLKTVDLIVTAFGDIAASARTGSRQAELELNTHGAREVGQKIKASGFHGILVNISNPCDVIVTLLQRQTGLPKAHIFGTGTYLDTSRMKRFVGEKAGVDPHNVHGYVLAEHGAEQFTAWSTVRVGDQSAEALFNADERQALSEEPNKNSMLVARGKGYTNWAIASTAWRLIETVFSNAHAIVPVSTYDEENGVYLSWPVVLGANGVEKRAVLHLTAAEQQQYDHAAQGIKARVAKTASF